MVRLRQNSDRTRGLQHWVPYVNREWGTCFVSIRAVATHFYVLTCFRGKFRNCFDGSRFGRRHLLQYSLQLSIIGSITATTPSQAPCNKFWNTHNVVTPDQAHGKKTWTRWWARCAVLGADLAVLGACYRWVWLCWARSARLGADLALMCMVYIVHVFMSLCLSACVSQVVSWGLSKTKPGIRE